MKTKFLLPMLAMIFAIGMSFAGINPKPEPKEQQANDYVLINGSWEAIPEQNCAEGDLTCRVQFGQGGPIYDVYDEMNHEEPKTSSSRNPNVINL